MTNRLEVESVCGIGVSVMLTNINFHNWEK